MRRREFIGLLGGAAAAWPIAARAQQAAMPVIGFLFSGMPESTTQATAAFRSGLADAGFVEGRNVAIEYRWSRNEDKRLSELAADLVRRRVAVLVAGGGANAAAAAKAATATIPIVFNEGGDPVRFGLVTSLNRPSGNITGIATLSVELGTKRLGLLHELLPGTAGLAMLVNPNSPSAERVIQEAHAVSSDLGRQIEIFSARSSREIDSAFSDMAQAHVAAVMISPSPLFADRRVQLVTVAIYHRVPTIYYDRQFAEIGGLMTYGPNAADGYRRVGAYAARILKGEKPADLPVEQSSRFELVINLQTARTLGLQVPPTLLAIADEVIE
jgi:putative ABC transport system substrate-binding protein